MRVLQICVCYIVCHVVFFSFFMYFCVNVSDMQMLCASAGNYNGHDLKKFLLLVCQWIYISEKIFRVHYKVNDNVNGACSTACICAFQNPWCIINWRKYIGSESTDSNKKIYFHEFLIKEVRKSTEFNEKFRISLRKKNIES